MAKQTKKVDVRGGKVRPPMPTDKNRVKKGKPAAKPEPKKVVKPVPTYKGFAGVSTPKQKAAVDVLFKALRDVTEATEGVDLEVTGALLKLGDAAGKPYEIWSVFVVQFVEPGPAKHGTAATVVHRGAPSGIGMCAAAEWFLSQVHSKPKTDKKTGTVTDSFDLARNLLAATWSGAWASTTSEPALYRPLADELPAGVSAQSIVEPPAEAASDCPAVAQEDAKFLAAVKAVVPADGTPAPIFVEAELWPSADDQDSVTFNAAPWLDQAKEDEIVALAKSGYGRYEATLVPAHFAAKKDAAVMEVLGRPDPLCEISETDVLNWAAANRPYLVDLLKAAKAAKPT